jgi:hypothetical protein
VSDPGKVNSKLLLLGPDLVNSRSSSMLSESVTVLAVNGSILGSGAANGSILGTGPVNVNLKSLAVSSKH